MRPITRERQDQAEIDSDVLLMERIANHDPVAFEILLKKYRQTIGSSVWVICRDHGMVEDVMQEASVALWNKASSFDPSKGIVVAWLVSLFRRKAIDAVRKVTRIKRNVTDLEAITTFDVDDWKPSDSVAQQETIEMIRSRLGILKVEQRQAIWLCYIKEMSHSDAASHLKIPLGTLKARIRRALDRLYASFSSRDGLRQS